LGRDVDAMAIPPDHDPVCLLPSNPEWVPADKALFDYPYSDYSPDHARWVDQKKDELRKQWGKEYFSKILDRVGIQISAANRVAMDSLENNPRFRWLFYVDCFMFPFDNPNMEINPDQTLDYPMQENVLHRYLVQASIPALPSDFADYESFIRRILENDRRQGALAITFEAAYFRSLHLSHPPRGQAEGIYAKYSRGDVPSTDECLAFQNHTFRYPITQAGPLHLQVHGRCR
jgi:hypothetical protein